jgi:hypothetical protein
MVVVVLEEGPAVVVARHGLDQAGGDDGGMGRGLGGKRGRGKWEDDRASARAVGLFVFVRSGVGT